MARNLSECLGSTLLAKFPEFQTTHCHNSSPLTEAINELAGSRPSAIIIDHQNPQGFDFEWNNIGNGVFQGSTYFSYKTVLRNTNRTIRVKPHPLKSAFKFHNTTTFGWLFICFLEKTRADGFIDAYLYKLLSAGHARRDNFLFVGPHILLKRVRLRPLVKRFRNFMTIETDSVKLQFHHHQVCKANIQTELFGFTASSKLPSWTSRERNCLSGHHFRIAGTDFPPFMYYLSPENSKSGAWEFKGINYNIISNGGAMYNYTISLDHPDNPVKWQLMGEQLQNGSWDGVFGDLINGRVEIASVSNPSPEANGLADFIGPFGQSKLIFVTANPITYADAGEYAILHPFSVPIWAILIAGFLFTWLLHSVALKLRFLRGQEKYSDSVRKGFMLMMAFSLDQEIRKPKGLPLRLMMVTWVALMIIMGTSYRCNLASYIVTPDPDRIPTSFEQLYAHEEYKIKFDKGGISGWNFFRTRNETKMRELVQRAEPTEDTCWCTTIAFRDISTVCAGWDFSLDFAAAKNLSLNVGDTPPLSKSEPISEAWFVFAIGNNSIFYNEFMQLGQAYFEQGIVSLWEESLLREEKYRGKQWLQGHSKTDVYDHLVAFQRRSSRTLLEKLRWKNVKFIFILFGIGISVSTGIFLLEVYKDVEIDVVKAMLRRNKRRIRKISKLVTRKISGEFAPSSAILKDGSTGSKLIASVPRAPTFTVTLIP